MKNSATKENKLVSINRKGEIVLQKGNYFLTSKESYALYTEVELYGKEPKISFAQLKSLLEAKKIKAIKLDYNYALGRQSTKWVVL